VQSIRLIERSSFHNANRVITLATLGCLALILAACAAPQEVVQEEKEYVWPGPPAQPVMRWESQFRSEKEFVSDEKKSSWKDVLLGDEEEEEGYV
jgi:hypothetical protein